MTLALLYLTSWREGQDANSVRRSWKGYDFDVLNSLDEQGLIYGSHRSKSAYFTEEGVEKAQEILAKLADGSLDSLEELRNTRLGGSIEPLPRKAYKLSMVLKDVEPKCTRMVCVPVDYSFLDLHVIIQELFGWLDYHLYDFSYSDKGGQRHYIREKSFDDNPFNSPYYESEEFLLAEETSLESVFSQHKRVVYAYDYGNGWEIAIERRKELDDYESSEPSFCNGQGATPPEDVGGPGGYEHFYAIFKDIDHPEHREMIKWAADQGFELFSTDAICDRLSEWRESKKIHLRDF